MIVVAGESLIDLIVSPQGQSSPAGDSSPATGTPVLASPGGSPFNTARTIARLGQPTRFLGRFSADPFGQMLAEQLAKDEVGIALPERVEEPTALAVVTLSDAGIPRYWFHLTGTAGFVLDQRDVERAMQGEITAVHIGSLGLVVEPMATEIERLDSGQEATGLP